MRTAISTGNGDNIHITIIVSAVLHLLFLALVAAPVRHKDRENSSYFVHLVSPAATQRAGDALLPDKPDIKPVEIAKEPPKKKEETVKVDMNRALPEEDRTRMRPPASHINSFPESSQKTGNDKIISRRGNQTAADAQTSMPADKGYRGTSFEDTSGPPEQQYAIARSVKTDRANTMPMELGIRGQTFEGKGDVPELPSAISSKNRPGRTEPAPASLKPDADRNAVFDRKRDVEIDYAERITAAGAIKKPGMPDQPAAGTAHIRPGGPSSGEDVLKREIEKVGSSASPAPEFSIQGIPLNDLSACTNALDEKALKNNILKIIGANTECNSPTKGKYLFLGTGRFSSFDMIIMPLAGRELSHRCEELKHAYMCLHSIKD